MFDKYVTKGSSSYKIPFTSNFVKKWHISLFSFSVEEFDSAEMKRFDSDSQSSHELAFDFIHIGFKTD